MYTSILVCLFQRYMLQNPPAHTFAQEYFWTETTKAKRLGDLTQTHCLLFLTFLASQRRKKARTQIILICAFSGTSLVVPWLHGFHPYREN